MENDRSFKDPFSEGVHTGALALPLGNTNKQWIPKRNDHKMNKSKDARNRAADDFKKRKEKLHKWIALMFDGLMRRENGKFLTTPEFFRSQECSRNLAKLQ